MWSSDEESTTTPVSYKARMMFREGSIGKSNPVMPPALGTASSLNLSGPPQIIITSNSGNVGVPLLSPLPQKKPLPVLTSGQSLTGYTAALEAQAIKKRRQFQVSRRVTLRLGWRESQNTEREIVEQSRTLCGRYIRCRLRSCSMAGKKLGLQRLKSVTNVPTSALVQGNSNSAEVISAVGLAIRDLSKELQKRHPKLFNSVTANIGLQAIQNEKTVRNLLDSVSEELFRTSVTWGRVVAMFAVSGGLAVDCVRLGRPEFVLGLVEALGGPGGVVERNLASWIRDQGGWVALHSLSQKCASERRHHSTVALLSILSVLAFGLLFFIVLFSNK